MMAMVNSIEHLFKIIEKKPCPIHADYPCMYKDDCLIYKRFIGIVKGLTECPMNYERRKEFALKVLEEKYPEDYLEYILETL